MEIATSILNISEDDYIKIFYNLEVAGTDYFHIDVMDGKFVENDNQKKMYEYANIIKNISNIPLDVHLMVKNTKIFIDKFMALEPWCITMHYEVFKEKEELKKIVEYVKKEGIKVGIAIKPNTRVEELFDILKYIHVVIVMTVEPGKGRAKNNFRDC